MEAEHQFTLDCISQLGSSFDDLKKRGGASKIGLEFREVLEADGIDSAVTRHAVIPFHGSIRDDYGLQAAGFEFLVDDETNWRPRPFSTRVTRQRTSIELGRDDVIQRKIFTIARNDNQQEIIEENVSDAEERDKLIQKIRKLLRLLGD